jgi:hypothetical protein
MSVRGLVLTSHERAIGLMSVGTLMHLESWNLDQRLSLDTVADDESSLRERPKHLVNVAFVVR